MTSMDVEETGLDVLDKLASGGIAEAALSRALFDGAGLTASQMAAALQSIPTEPFRYATDANPREASPEEIALLMDGVGISRFKRDDDGVSTGVAFDGYGDLAGHRVPVIVIARAINSGASFRRKRPFARKAGKGVEQVIAETLDSELKKTIGE